MTVTATSDPGLYKLTRDVENPHGDRRHKYEWRVRSLFREGTAFRLSHYLQEKWEHDGVEIAPERNEVWLHPNDERQGNGIKLGHIVCEDGTFHSRNGTYADIALALLNSMELNEPTDFDGLYALYRKNLDSYDGCRAIVKLFVQQGKLTLAEVETAMKQVEDYSIFDAIGEPNE